MTNADYTARILTTSVIVLDNERLIHFTTRNGSGILSTVKDVLGVENHIAEYYVGGNKTVRDFRDKDDQPFITAILDKAGIKI